MIFCALVLWDVMLHCGYHGGAVSVLVDVTTDATGVTSSALWCK